MKTKLAILALTLSFGTSAFSSEAINFTIKSQQEITFKKVSKTRFEKIISTAKGIASLDYINGDKVETLHSQEISETDDKNVVILEATGKNVLRIIDAKENIDTEVPAEIEKSLLGNIKSINISSATMEAAYAAAFKKAGIDTLKNLKILGKNGAGLTSTITSSDLSCAADGDLLACKQDVDVVLTVKN